MDESESESVSIAPETPGVYVVISSYDTKFSDDFETIVYQDEITIRSVHTSLQSAMTSLPFPPDQLKYESNFNTDCFILGEAWYVGNDPRYLIVKRELLE